MDNSTTAILLVCTVTIGDSIGTNALFLSIEVVIYRHPKESYGRLKHRPSTSSSLSSGQATARSRAEQMRGETRLFEAAPNQPVSCKHTAVSTDFCRRWSYSPNKLRRSSEPVTWQKKIIFFFVIPSRPRHNLVVTCPRDRPLSRSERVFLPRKA